MLNNNETIRHIIAYAREEPLSAFRIHHAVRILCAAIQLIHDDVVDVPSIITILSSHMVFFCDVLRSCPSAGTSKELGLTRLGVVELLSALITIGFPIIVDRMSESSTFCVLLDLFFQHPWSNILHFQVTQIFSALLHSNHRKVMHVGILKGPSLVQSL